MDPSKPDAAFRDLTEDLRENGQREPGVITRQGVLVNGNTRRAALKDLGILNMRVGVLPTDAALDDIQTIELSLQLRKDFKRDYSFMNFLLAVDERVAAGRVAADIQADFRIRATTYERSRWILAFIREAIDRSRLESLTAVTQLKLVDFETDQGKLEELYRAYGSLKNRSPDRAEALREERLLAIALKKSKTDLRLIGADFVQRYLPKYLPAPPEVAPGPPRTIPGTGIPAPATDPRVDSLRRLTTAVLQARGVADSRGSVPAGSLPTAPVDLETIDAEVDDALNQAGRNERIIKRRLAAADRLSDAADDLDLSIAAVAEARATNNFSPEELDDSLLRIKSGLRRLGQAVARSPAAHTDGLVWLSAVASLPELPD
ncbi:MAG: transcriptional regulator [Candidatus Dormibacteria bacterium]